MRVIPVIDLLNGVVVRGIAGRRSEYRPIESRIAADSRPTTVARAFVERFGFETAYVADLEAIMHDRPNIHAWREIRATGLKLWIDAGLNSIALAAGLSPDTTVVIGLESLVSPLAATDALAELGSSRIVFSLDLKNGQPLTTVNEWESAAAIAIARSVLEAGITRMIVLDLADVGTSGGTGTMELCRSIRREYPNVELIAGGGVRGLDDLTALADAGCDAALVASALHDGRLTREVICRMCER